MESTTAIPVAVSVHHIMISPRRCCIFRFFNLEYFYLPIFQSRKKGLFTMFFYIVKKQDDDLVVTLDHVLKATEEGYELQSFTEWHETHSISELDSYRMTIEQKQAKGHKPEAAPSAICKRHL